MPGTKVKTFSRLRKRKVSTCCDVYSFDGERVMKCPRNDISKINAMEKVAAAAEVLRILPSKASPVKEPEPAFAKPQCPPTETTTVLFSPKSDTSPVHNKENSKAQDRTLVDEGLDDSGYISLHSSRIDDERISPLASPVKCSKRESGVHPAVSTPVDLSRTRTSTHTPSHHHKHPYLPVLDFQHAVCEELAKSYQKNKKFDWNVVSKVAENYHLDRVIGRQMGLEHVDVFSSLQLRNMKCILTKILGMLGDSDLVSCKQVCKTWRKIVSADKSALERCQKAEDAFRESRNSVKQTSLTRDVVSSRVVLSCTQSLAKASSSSSALSCRTNQKDSRFNQYLQAASKLKQHESLCPCRRCDSPATHSTHIQRAICTREGCGFDFCTSCHEPFHGSAPCRTLRRSSSKTSIIIPGSALSRRNVRRL
ncbi:F-box only protein 5 [Gouania willdenowi]|uniref:ZBR-type domain-containing protein n=1 Tax=Gouania willdenowi TaxID=441366 RepID=A0A8C5HR41_GOUWI|nr:F-box only protein 5 [Gouania willdenowi]